MNFVFTNHAKQRMIEREIDLNKIKETILTPDYTISKETKFEAYKKFENKTLKVVYTKGKFIKIITLIWK
ncbi:DUF4258 domain-containing protein [Candidatus Pacearchaeota archaeon]|nr:DUF4258 domain-containing protein [Candidatus Pacearchaeota archaeon]